MRILVTGSDGLVGTNILPVLEEHFEVVRAVEADWDICDRARGEEMLDRVAPDILLNLAAITNVDGCEDMPELAYRVNGEGPGVLAGICSERNVKLVQLSTDYVFDGAKRVPYGEDDPTNPISVYGKSKLMGEQAVMARVNRALIVRTEWIYGKGGDSFIDKITRIGRKEGQVKVVNDQIGSPTYARDLALPLKALIEGDRYGIYHVTNDGFCSWFDFARELFALLAMDVACVPIITAQSQRKAQRPAYSVLSCNKMKTDTGLQMRHWREALSNYLGAPERARDDDTKGLV